MAITDPAAIKYSNEHLRPMADKLARCYYKAHTLKDQWASMPGNNDEKFAMLAGNIKNVASTFFNSYWQGAKAEAIWRNASMSALIPNDPAQVLWDNATGTGPDLSRPTVTGQDLRRLKNRMEEFGNWLDRGTDADQQWLTNGAPGLLAVTFVYLDDFGKMAADGAKAPTTAWGRTVAVDRCGQIVTRWETTSPSDLQHILRVAVNPIENGG